MKNVVFSAARYLPPPGQQAQVTGLTRMFSMWDNELIEDVTERFVQQISSDGTTVPQQVVSTKLAVAQQAVDGMVCPESYYIPPATPFCIQAKANLQAQPHATNWTALMAVWHETTTSQRSWMLTVMPDYSVRFTMSANGGASSVAVSTPANVVAVNTPFHVAVERDANNLVTIYINGVVKGSGIISSGSTRIAQRLSVRKGFVGQVWDMAISSKVVFGKEFTPPAKFVHEGYAPKYTTAIAADIVAQFGFRRDDCHNEVTGKPFAFISNAAVKYGQLYGGNTAAERHTADIDYFGAADFTYEVKFRVHAGSSIPAEGVVLPSHWHNGAQAHDNNRYLFLVQPNGSINVGFGINASTIGSTSISSAGGLVGVGKDYHFVAERQNGVLKGYLDGVLILTLALPNPLWATTNNKLFNYYTGSTTSQVYVWDIRIAKRAMYKGNVVTPNVLPKMPVDYKAAIPPFTLRVGSAETPNGTMRGFAKNFLYTGTSLSFGELYPQVYWNSTQNRMVRIKAITTQGGSYAVITHAPSNEPRQADTPIMTNRLKIGASVYDIVTGTPSGKANVNDVGVYYVTGDLAANFTTDEQSKTISFV